MNEIVEAIRSIRNKRKELESQEKELILSLKPFDFSIDLIFDEFKKFKSIETFRSYDQKKMFVFVCALTICPTFTIGDRLPRNSRDKISRITGLHKTQISHIVSEVIISYQRYKDFKQEADYLYNSIRRSLTS